MLKKIPVKKEEEKVFDPIEALTLNKNNLIQELEMMAVLTAKITRMQAEKYQIAKEEEMELEILRDALAENMRLEPEVWGLKAGEKISDALVNRIVVRDDRYQAQYKKYIAAKTQEKEYDGLVKACDHKSYSIGNAITLWEKNYF